MFQSDFSSSRSDSCNPDISQILVPYILYCLCHEWQESRTQILGTYHSHTCWGLLTSGTHCSSLRTLPTFQGILNPGIRVSWGGTKVISWKQPCTPDKEKLVNKYDSPFTPKGDNWEVYPVRTHRGPQQDWALLHYCDRLLIGVLASFTFLSHFPLELPVMASHLAWGLK